MNHWMIAESELKNEYLITTEKSIWITHQEKDADIVNLIQAKNLGDIKSIRYEDLKEIIFIDTDLSIEFVYKNDDTDEDEYVLNSSVYNEIKSYLKSKLRGVEIKDYSVFKQILPQLIVLGISGVFTFATYSSAIELENGGTVSVSGRRAWIKQILVSIGEFLGSTGTLIVGGLIMAFFGYLIVKVVKNPKKGEVIKISKSPSLVV